MLRMLSTLGAGVLLALLSPLAGVAPAAVADDDTDDFSFVSFDADYYVTRADDGSSRLRTVETLVARFPDRDQNRGIVRAIPLGFEGADLAPVVTSVTDADGVAVPYSEDRDDGFLEIGTGTDDYVRGDQTYVIEYEQRSVTRSYDDTAADEFYWDINGTGWSQPFGEVSARVHVPADLIGALTGSSACYSGDEGDRGDCTVTERPDADGSVFAASATDLGAEQTLTIAIGFDRGTFDEPTRTRDQAWVTVLPAVVAGIGALLAALAGLLRVTRWRDARGRGVIVAQYERPDGVDLLEAGELVGRRGTAMSAALMDLAVRGNLRVIDRTPDDVADDREFSLEFVTLDGLTRSERKVMQAMFGRSPAVGERRRIGSSAEVGRSLATQAKNARERVVEKGWRRTLPTAAVGVLATFAGVVGVGAFVVLVVLAVVDGLTWPGAGLLVAAGALAVLAAVAAAKRSSVTESGAAIRDHLLGLREYIHLAEADRIRMLQSPASADRCAVPASDRPEPGAIVHVYERVLPFAVLFGLEKQWAGELERLYAVQDTGPRWYVGPQPFDSSAFRGFVVASQAQTSASSWSGSAAGSGFGGSTGGGFAGGGGGGGGGGGR